MTTELTYPAFAMRPTDISSDPILHEYLQYLIYNFGDLGVRQHTPTLSPPMVFAFQLPSLKAKLHSNV